MSCFYPPDRIAHSSDVQTDPQVIKDQLLNVLLAGRDTTAALLTFVTYVMATQPEVARKMRAEVLEHIGEHDAPTFEGVKSLRYCEYFPLKLSVIIFTTDV